MDITTYAVISSVIIMVWHFAMNSSPRYFGLFQMAGIFVFGGFIGWYIDSLFFAVCFSMLLSLFFIE